MVSIVWYSAIVALLVLLGELLHQARIHRLGHLLFGQRKRPEVWTQVVPWLRFAAAGLLAWGLLTLLWEVEPKKHGTNEIKEDEWKHLVLVLDVSPSMRLEDAGPNAEQSRLHRGRDVLNSIFGRVAMGRYKVSVVATYSSAMPVVIDTTDVEVLQNVLGDLPMHYAFKRGETRLFDGLEEAAKIAKDWKKDSTTLLVLSDGDTLPPTGMPQMPASIKGTLVVGVGDPTTGTFIDGRNSRQDVSNLRQMAARLNGTYHDGNKRHVATTVLEGIATGAGNLLTEKWSKREYALAACLLGALLLALIPLLLHLWGNRFEPGVRIQPNPGGGPRGGTKNAPTTATNDPKRRRQSTTA